MDDALKWARRKRADHYLSLGAGKLAEGMLNGCFDTAPDVSERAEAYRTGHAAGQSAAAERVAVLEAALRAIAEDHIVYHKGFGPSDGDGYVMDPSEIAEAALKGTPHD